jgi:hypothetical protein
MRRTSLPIVVTVMLAAGACTPMRWEHLSLSGDAAQAESGECRQAAWGEAQRQSFYSGFGAFPSRWVRGRDGRMYLADPWTSQRHANAFFLEAQLYDFCMRNKGFRLVPAG